VNGPAAALPPGRAVRANAPGEAGTGMAGSCAALMVSRRAVAR